jgi:hypothetical protein
MDEVSKKRIFNLVEGLNIRLVTHELKNTRMEY